jgi:hypothetical protein
MFSISSSSVWVYCLPTLCLSVFPTNKYHIDLNLVAVEVTALYSLHDHWTLDLSYSLSDWWCALLYCPASNVRKSSFIKSQKNGVNINQTYCSEFIVSWKYTGPIILWAH